MCFSIAAKLMHYYLFHVFLEPEKDGRDTAIVRPAPAQAWVSQSAQLGFQIGSLWVSGLKNEAWRFQDLREWREAWRKKEPSYSSLSKKKASGSW
jgi:hypothetical protein